MPFLTQGKINWKYILITVILVIIAGGGILIHWYKELPKKEIKTPEKKTSETISLNETWNSYVNHKLGFSLNIPKSMPGLNRCMDYGDTEKQFLVPIEIFEDYENNIIFISPQYYYDAEWNPEGKQIGPCKKILFSLESLRGEKNPFLGWAIVIKSVKDERDLDKFIKENYGSGCFAGDKKPWKQDGVYEIVIKGEDWDKEGIDLGNTTCPWNYAYKLLFYPEKGKVMSVNLGQECNFYNETDPNSESYRCYDMEMIESFRFK
jgi:hypothetical protein